MPSRSYRDIDLQFSTMTRPPLSLAMLLLCVLMVVTPTSALAVPTAASPTTSSRSLVDSFLGLHHESPRAGDLRKRQTIWTGLTVTEKYVFSSIVTTRTIFRNRTVTRTKTTWKTKTAKPSGPSITPEAASGDLVVTRTTTVTVITTASTGGQKVKRYPHHRIREAAGFDTFPKLNEKDNGVTTGWTVTSTELTRNNATASVTRYTGTVTRFITTTTRFTTITPVANRTSSAPLSGIPARVTYVTVTETITAPPTAEPTGGGGGGSSLNKRALAGGIVAGLVAIAGLIGVCFFLRRKTNQGFRRKTNLTQDTDYSSVLDGSGDEVGQTNRPAEAEGLMNMPPLQPLTPAMGGQYGNPDSPHSGSAQLPLPLPINIIPPSSSTSLHTNTSPTQLTDPIAAVTAPVPASRYTHLSPPIPSSEFAPRTTQRRRSDSLAANIMPPPLQQYRNISEATTLRQEGSGSHSPTGSLYSQDDRAGGAFALVQKDGGGYVEDFISPLSPPMQGSKWSFGERVRRASGPSPTPTPYEYENPEIYQRERLLQQQREYQEY